MPHLRYLSCFCLCHRPVFLFPKFVTHLTFIFVTDFFLHIIVTYIKHISNYHLCHRLVFLYHTCLCHIFATYIFITYLYFHLIFTDRSLFGPVIRWLFPLTSPLQGSISYSTPVFKGGRKVIFLLFFSLSRQYFPVFKEKFVFSLPPGSNPRHPVGTKNQISAETL